MKKKHYHLLAEPGFYGLKDSPKMATPTIGRQFLALDCGNCGGRSFAVVVTPTGETAEITAVECQGCGNGWLITGGTLQTTGEINLKEGRRNGHLQ